MTKSFAARLVAVIRRLMPSGDARPLYPVAGIALLFLLQALVFRSVNVEMDVARILGKSFLATCIYGAMYVVVFSVSPWRLSLFWLGLPTLIFAMGWLRIGWALPLCALWGYALLRAAQLDNACVQRSPRGVAWGALLILCWVCLSGAGGYGFQTPDYVMHNGRLLDLVRHAWPVRYDDSRLLVMYSGYYLPSALLGKWLGEQAAFESIHYWTLLGCWLAYRWLLEFSRAITPVLVAAVLVLFGGWDVVGVLWGLYNYTREIAVAFDPLEYLALMCVAGLPDWLDFWPATIMRNQYYFGNYVSLTASLVWAPHQSIAGWIGMALLVKIWRQRWLGVVGFVYALLALWSPMALLGLLLFPLFMVMQYRAQAVRQLFSFINVACGGMLILVLGTYYASASALTNPVAWFFPSSGLAGVGPLLKFYLLSWGIHAALLWFFVRKQGAESRWYFAALCVTFLLLPLFQYGSYNDLMVRCAAPLMFGLAVVFLYTISDLRRRQRRSAVVLLVVCLLPGSISGFLHLLNSIHSFVEHVPAQSVIDYGGGWQFLGQQDSWYVRWFSAPR